MDSSSGIYQLVYVSNATEPMRFEDLCEIATTSQASNSALGITGLLLYADGRFLQFLEGSRHHVGGKFEAIRDDRRHHSVYVMRRRFIPARQFAAWSMRLTDPGEIDRQAGEVYDGLFNDTGGDPHRRQFAMESWAILSAFRPVGAPH
jgi:hypothetical protein